MNLRDLHYLVTVADVRSFIHAAEQCFISQPTLSTQIKKMEERLGVVLFERNNKKVIPTEIGEQVIASARRILLEMDNIKQLAQNAKNPLAGNFRLGAFPTLASYVFPGLVPLIKSELPALRLILVEEKTEVLLAQLRQGQLDAALLALPVYDEHLVCRKLFEDEFLLAVAQDNPLAQLESINQNDLYQQQILLLDEGHCLRDQALQVCQINAANEQQDVRATSLETLRQMVRAGTGITFMPQIALPKNADGITYIPFTAPAPKRVIGLVWRKTSAREALLEIVGRLVIRLSDLGNASAIMYTIHQ